MIDLKSEYEQHKGTYITCGVLALLSVFGMSMAILGPMIGENKAALLGLGVIVFIVLTWIGVAKGARMAKVIAGILLMIIGLGLTGFILYEFVTSLFKGESMMGRGLTAENYGTQSFILAAVGFGIFGLGLFLVGIIK
jgi:hypothetical protein